MNRVLRTAIGCTVGGTLFGALINVLDGLRRTALAEGPSILLVLGGAFLLIWSAVGVVAALTAARILTPTMTGNLEWPRIRLAFYGCAAVGAAIGIGLPQLWLAGESIRARSAAVASGTDWSGAQWVLYLLPVLGVALLGASGTVLIILGLRDLPETVAFLDEAARRQGHQFASTGIKLSGSIVAAEPGSSGTTITAQVRDQSGVLLVDAAIATPRGGWARHLQRYPLGAPATVTFPAGSPPDPGETLIEVRWAMVTKAFLATAWRSAPASDQPPSWPGVEPAR